MKKLIIAVILVLSFVSPLFAQGNMSVGDLKAYIDAQILAAGSATARELTGSYLSPNTFGFTGSLDTSAVMIFRNGILQPQKLFTTSVINSGVDYTPAPTGIRWSTNAIWNGQTFTAPSMTITKLEIPAAKTGAVTNVNLRFYNTSGGLPTTSLYSQSITASCNSLNTYTNLASLSTLSVTLTTPLNLSGGVYAFMVEVVSGADIYFGVVGNFPDNYTGGDTIYYNTQFPPAGFLSYDLVFKLTGSPLTSLTFKNNVDAADEIIAISTK